MNLLDYIGGQRSGKKANEIEKRSLADPFLKEAIDGFDAVEGDHIAAIRDLKGLVSPSKKRYLVYTYLRWTTAACLILGILSGGYWFVGKDQSGYPLEYEFAMIEMAVPEDAYIRLEERFPLFSDVMVSGDLVAVRSHDEITLYLNDEPEISDEVTSLNVIELYIPEKIYEAHKDLINYHNTEVDAIMRYGSPVVDIYIPDNY